MTSTGCSGVHARRSATSNDSRCVACSCADAIISGDESSPTIVASGQR